MIRPGKLHLLLHITQLVQRSPEQCWKCCKSFAGLRKRSMKARAVVQMVGLRFKPLTAFLRYLCWSLAENMSCCCVVFCDAKHAVRQQPSNVSGIA